MHSGLQVADAGADDFAVLLASLKSSHEHLAVEMANMEALTQRAEPDGPALSSLRWRLSQASLARRTLAGRICELIQSRIGTVELCNVKQLLAADRALARDSAAHVAGWSSASIQKDWEAYCKASRKIRWKLRSHLGLEQRLLFPILAELARSANRIGNGASDGARTRDLRRDRPAL